MAKTLNKYFTISYLNDRAENPMYVATELVKDEIENLGVILKEQNKCLNEEKPFIILKKTSKDSAIGNKIIV